MVQKSLFVFASLMFSLDARASFEMVRCSSADGMVRYRYEQRFDAPPEIEWTLNGETVQSLAGGFVSKPVVLDVRERPIGYNPMFTEKTYYSRVKFDALNLKHDRVSAEVFILCVSQAGR